MLHLFCFLSQKCSHDTATFSQADLNQLPCQLGVGVGGGGGDRTRDVGEAKEPVKYNDKSENYDWHSLCTHHSMFVLVVFIKFRIFS